MACPERLLLLLEYGQIRLYKPCHLLCCRTGAKQLAGLWAVRPATTHHPLCGYVRVFGFLLYANFVG